MNRSDWGRLILIGCLVGVGSGCGQEYSLAPADYQAFVSAFFRGVSALEVGAFDQAEIELGRATELGPGEPTAWANRGVLRLRRGDYDGASKDLKTARSLMPESAALAMLQGLVERARGRSDTAIDFFRQATKSGHLRAGYALMKEVERRGGADSQTEAWMQLEALLKQAPDNSALWLERARQAGKRSDAAVLGESIGRIDGWAEGWPEAAQAQVTLLKAEAEKDIRKATLRVMFLHNVLLRTPMYRRALDELIVPAERLGDPVFEFLKLDSPRSTPAPPDLEMGFQMESIGGLEGERWHLVKPLWMEEKTEVLAANVSGVQGTGGTSLSFSGLSTAHGILTVDWDNDFEVDLALAGADGFRLFRRVQSGGVEDVTSRTGLAAEVTGTACLGVWGADIEMDGDVDLVLGRSEGAPLVLRNNGDGSFVVQEPFGGLERVKGFVWTDHDGDGDPDAAMLDGQGQLVEAINERAGVFEIGSERPMAGIVLAAGDLDRDGEVERLVLDRDGNVIASSQGEIRNLVSSSPPVETPMLLVADLDNNGALDLVSGKRAWLADDSEFQSLEVGGQVTGVVDLTGDGRLDLLGVSDAGEAVRLVNQGKREYHWQAIRPLGGEALGDRRINALGLGAEVELRSGLLYQKQVVTDPVVHFGLGTHTGADLVRIVWPNGTPQAEFDLKANQLVRAVQRLKGSCPWVFAYNGSGMEFVTDFLWRSPLGMRINSQVVVGTAQTEDWVKIRGDQLMARDGTYDIRITAELWETHFFDAVSLAAVDHPAGTSVFVDERFTRASPDLKVYATTEPQSFARVQDDKGQDVSDLVRVRDGQYLDTSGRGTYQGVTRDHWVEVTLEDDVPANGRLWLIGQGWIYPTDSSINVAIGQGNHPGPRGLSLEVFDGIGWRVVHSDLGFPAGKRKTVLIDLTGVFLPDVPRRFRLRTNLEIYWDRLAWAVPLEDNVMNIQTVSVESAQLHFRGFSKAAQADSSSPEVPNYGTLSNTSQLWRDLVGYHTRYGDVRPLLAQVDDRYVIMNAGDEMRFRFAALPNPNEGQVRDFVLKGDGWVKDGDYNTAFSTTVLPLPAHDISVYDRPPGALEDDPVFQRHSEDWQQFHTRYVTPERFGRALGH